MIQKHPAKGTWLKYIHSYALNLESTWHKGLPQCPPVKTTAESIWDFQSIELSKSPKNKTDFKAVDRGAEGPWDKIP